MRVGVPVGVPIGVPIGIGVSVGGGVNVKVGRGVRVGVSVGTAVGTDVLIGAVVTGGVRVKAAVSVDRTATSPPPDRNAERTMTSTGINSSAPTMPTITGHCRHQGTGSSSLSRLI